MTNKTTTSPAPLAPPRVATMADVLRASQRRAQDGKATPEQAPAPTLDEVNNKLAQAVAMKANLAILSSANEEKERPREGIGAESTGLAALITALGGVMRQGGDPSQAKAELQDYLVKHDEASIRTEIAEIRQALQQPGGNTSLEILQTLGTLGIIGNQGHAESLVDQIKALKEAGIIPTVSAPKSLIEQLTEAVQLVNLLRPPAAPAPTSVIQFPGGGSLSVNEFLQVEDWKAKREDAAHQRDLDKDRLKLTQETMPKVFEFARDGIEAYVRTQKEEGPDHKALPPAKGAPAQQPRMATLQCGLCHLAVEYQTVVEEGIVDKVQCPRCQAIVDLEGKVLQKPEAAPEAAPAKSQPGGPQPVEHANA